MPEKEDAEEGVKVTDKRRFGTNGTPKEDAAGAKQPKAAKDPPPPPPMDFSTFTLSLATSAQVHLGVVPNPSTGALEKNLAIAKETIDLLGLMQEKTRGNLSDQEARLLEHVLYDLRMIYVEMDKQG